MARTSPLLSLVGRSTLDGTAPCLLYGYGAYESCLDPEFDRQPAVAAGPGRVYAVAHVRGGGEGGRGGGSRAGCAPSPPRSATSSRSPAGWPGTRPGGPWSTAPDRLPRASAGGLLQGAVYSRAPGRWRAVVAEVPFVDCVTTMLDPSIPLTINEWDEWGDPRDPDDYACLRSYSPYDNPPPGRAPAAGHRRRHDPRVRCTSRPSGWRGCGRPTPPEPGAVPRGARRGRAHRAVGRFGHCATRLRCSAFILDALGAA